MGDTTENQNRIIIKNFPKFRKTSTQTAYNQTAKRFPGSKYLNPKPKNRSVISNLKLLFSSLQKKRIKLFSNQNVSSNTIYST